MKNTVFTRPLRSNDAEFLCSIFKNNTDYYNIFFDSEDSVSEWQKRIDRFLMRYDMTHHIIEASGVPVGWLSCMDGEQNSLEIGILVIKPDCLGQGYGAQGLLWIINKAKFENKDYVLLNVNQSNTRAIAFYQHFGFKICAEEIVPQCNDAENLAQYKMRLDLK